MSNSQNPALTTAFVLSAVAIFLVVVPLVAERYETVKYENALKLDPDHGVLVTDETIYNHDGTSWRSTRHTFMGVDESSEYYKAASGWWRLP